MGFFSSTLQIYVRLLYGEARIFPNSNATTGNQTESSSVAPLLWDLNPGHFIDRAPATSKPSVLFEPTFSRCQGLRWSRWARSQRCRWQKGSTTSRPGSGTSSNPSPPSIPPGEPRAATKPVSIFIMVASDCLSLFNYFKEPNILLLLIWRGVLKLNRGSACIGSLP